ncbi:hypothetical protein ACFLSX_02495 [Calditrichota bacterium]
MFQQKIFYNIKPLIPRYLQIAIRRIIVQKKKQRCKNIWPIDEKSGIKPKDWKGWPGNKRFALVLTHDVENDQGQKKCIELMSLEKELGFCSSFYFVPQRYSVSQNLRQLLIDNGFEVGIHGLKHDGRLYESKLEFKKRACLINQYIDNWKCEGFRSPAMHHNLDWLHELNIEYDLSTFDTDPFEPQSDGVHTIFPFIKKNGDSGKYFVELPYTLPQDFTLFILMKEQSIEIWKKKFEWIARKGGMVLLNTHPDYMNFESSTVSIETYKVEYYKEFLHFIKTKYKNQYWHTLAKKAAKYISESSKTK